MFAILLVFALSAPLSPAVPSSRPLAITERSDLAGALHQRLMQKFAAMNEAHNGIFHDDVTDVVAPFFPAGQSFDETERVLKAQGFEPLRPFKGEAGQPGQRIYISRHDLMAEMFSGVHVVIDFVFDDTDGRMTLGTVRAFLQAASM